MKKNIISIILTFFISFIFYYITLPALNLSNPSFWIFIIFILITFIVISLITSSFSAVQKINLRHIPNNSLLNEFKDLPKKIFIPICIIIGIILMQIVVNFFISPLFNAKGYHNRIIVDETGNFINDIEEVDFNRVPLLDRDSSEKLGDRVMGQIGGDFVSQYYVSDRYAQINYNDEIIRVTSLEYDGLIKWFTNRKNGIKAYITVNSVTGEAKFVRTDKGMKIMPSAFFNENLKRTIRFKYPTTMTDETVFEIDNEGNPYWITPTVSYKGIGLMKKITGVIITDPFTGESKKYKKEDIPTWVDNAYRADLIIEQVNDWGTYKNGFWNSIFGQRNVVNTTEGYNYLIKGDDVYLYTGITSVLTDESNLGFILTNMRTSETTYYDVPGAEEYSAMESAKGQVQQMNYNSTFPLLINLNNKPTYLVSLKDNAGLVKMYAFIDVGDYQKVVVTDASEGVLKASDNYLKQYRDGKPDIIGYKEITVKKVNSGIIDGNTYIYITDTNDKKYKILLKNSEVSIFLNPGDKITVWYQDESDITELTRID